jgi:hypothetical protein
LYFVKDFHVSGEEQLPLPVSLFLAGYVFGPVFFAPLSETYGRKIVLLPSFIAYSAFTLGCALAPNWPSFMVFRLLVGVFASTPYTIAGGILADIYVTKLARGRAITTLLAVRNRTPARRVVLTCLVHECRTSDWAHHLRLCIPIRLEVDFLDQLHHLRCVLAFVDLPPRLVLQYYVMILSHEIRNSCTNYSGVASTKTTST